MHKVTQDSIFNEHEKFETFLECPYLIIKLWRAKSIQNKPVIGKFTKKKKKKKVQGTLYFELARDQGIPSRLRESETERSSWISGKLNEKQEKNGFEIKTKVFITVKCVT